LRKIADYRSRILSNPIELHSMFRLSIEGCYKLTARAVLSLRSCQVGRQQACKEKVCVATIEGNFCKAKDK